MWLLVGVAVRAAISDQGRICQWVFWARAQGPDHRGGLPCRSFFFFSRTPPRRSPVRAVLRSRYLLTLIWAYCGYTICSEICFLFLAQETMASTLGCFVKNYSFSQSLRNNYQNLILSCKSNRYTFLNWLCTFPGRIDTVVHWVNHCMQNTMYNEHCVCTKEKASMMGRGHSISVLRWEIQNRGTDPFSVFRFGIGKRETSLFSSGGHRLICLI